MTERAESERAELVALEAELRRATYGKDGPTSPKILGLMVAAADALRRLAAQDQKPVAWRWRVVGDSSWTMTKTKPKVKVLSSARFEVEIEPLFAAPPPAAGWDGDKGND